MRARPHNRRPGQGLRYRDRRPPRGRPAPVRAYDSGRRPLRRNPCRYRRRSVRGRYLPRGGRLCRRPPSLGSSFRRDRGGRSAARLHDRRNVLRSRDRRAGIIRAIGDVYARFDEDHLRMLRAVRFAARLGFAIDPATWAAIKRSAPAIAHISAERIGEELAMIMTEGGAARGLDLLIESGLAAVVMPEVLELSVCPQPRTF